MNAHEKLAISPDNFAEMIDRRRTFVYGHIRAGNIKTVSFGDGIRIPIEEAKRVAREGLPSLKSATPK